MIKIKKRINDNTSLLKYTYIILVLTILLNYPSIVSDKVYIFLIYIILPSSTSNLINLLFIYLFLKLASFLSIIPFLSYSYYISNIIYSNAIYYSQISIYLNINTYTLSFLHLFIIFIINIYINESTKS
jgi:hypothetical protein